MCPGTQSPMEATALWLGKVTKASVGTHACKTSIWEAEAVGNSDCLKINSKKGLRT